MTNKHGEFIWYELITKDIPASSAFYGTVLGWKVRPAGVGDHDYHLISTGEADVGGMMVMPSEAAANGMPPMWLGYVGVDDVDATAASLVEAGASQHIPPTDIPGVGRFAYFADPQGAPFYIMRGAMEGTSLAFAPDKVGHTQWNELSTSDQDAAIAFYSSQFGWQNPDSMPMGEMGEYKFLSHNDVTFGAVMRLMAGNPRSAWLYYFGVADIDVADAAIKQAGGSIMHGPTPIPGDLFIIVATDTHGAAFGLVGPRK